MTTARTYKPGAQYVEQAAAMAFARRVECEADGLYFARYFLKYRTGSKMVIGRHHPLIQGALERVLAGEINRLIITLPPGYSKTEQALIQFTARGLALHPRSRFMHLTYSDNLARLSSSYTRQTVTSPPFQTMWPMKIRNDTNAKNMWWTEQEGGVYATTPLGQVTGFRAGYMTENVFTGALSIDDPLKPADALSKTVRQSVNDNYGDTIASRLALESVPIVLIMQRLHYDDLAGFLLRGGSGERWHHLNLPVIIDNSKPYPAENTHGVPIDYDLPDGWLWPFKHNEEHRAALQAHKRKWQAQYMQDPKRFDAEGALWSETVIDKARRRSQPWKKKRTVVGVDPAVSNNEDSDLHGIVAASAYTDDCFSVDADRSLRGTPRQWADAAIKLHDELDADAIVIEKNQGGDMCADTLRNAGFTGRIIEVHASKGKFARAEPIEALYEMGLVKHDEDADLVELESELMEYVPATSKKSPDRLDAMVWALTDLSGGSATAAVW